MRLPRIPRSALLLIYVVALGVWGLLTYDTVGLWRMRQIEAQHFLAEAALGPTATPTLPATGTPLHPTGTSVPTVEVVPTPTAIPAAKLHPKTGKYLAAWLPTSFDANQARTSFEANKDILDEVSPFWYIVNPHNGQITPDIGARDASLVKAAHDADVLVIPTTHNVDDPNPNAILGLLQNTELRTTHIAVLVNETLKYNYDGIDIDYESIAPSGRPAYSAFMQELSDALHAKGKLLTVAVHAKTSDAGGLGGFQDWKLLGQICDRIRIMTYDYSWRGSLTPGPIAPLTWVSQVSDYARSVMPPAKVQIGVPFYAYKWDEGSKEAQSLTWMDVQRLIDSYTPQVFFSESDSSGPIQESTFKYTAGGHLTTVWFASARALEAKLQLVDKQELGGIAIWRLGSEDPANWQVIRKQLSNNPALIQRLVNTYLPDH